VVLRCFPLLQYGFSGYIGADATYYWYDIVSWYKASKDGGMPSGVLIIIAFIVLAPLMEHLLLIRYLFGCTECLTKSIYPNFTIGLMIATVWFVYIQMIPYEEIIRGGKNPICRLCF
jgi:PiT family inorganic phosphate transporter